MSLNSRGRPSNHQLPEALKKEAIALVKRHYHDFGPTLACEYLLEQHQLSLSVETLRKMMVKEGLWRYRQRKDSRIHQQRERRPAFGELIQLDGSPHDWFEGRGPKCCLLVLIDDATSALLGLRFEETETTFGYFRLVESYAKEYGLPAAFYSDKHSIFRINLPDAKSGTGLSQFGRAMQDLDIELIHAHSPQAKGRVERVNRTLQDRLIKAMRLVGISSIEQGNAFCPGFIEDYNYRFAVAPKCEANAHRQLPHDDEALAHILSLHTTRTLSKNLECSVNNVIYQIQTQTHQRRLQHAKIVVKENRQGEVTLWHGQDCLEYKQYSKHEKMLMVEDSKTLNKQVDVVVKRAKARSKPVESHPWRNFVINPKNAEKQQNTTL